MHIDLVEILIGAENKKGFHSVRVNDHEYEDNVKAAEACPVKIIQVTKLKWFVFSFVLLKSPRLSCFKATRIIFHEIALMKRQTNSVGSNKTTFFWVDRWILKVNGNLRTSDKLEGTIVVSQHQTILVSNLFLIFAP